MLISIKVILTGDGAVGKTTLRRKYMGQTTASRYLPTLGADISINNFQFEDEASKELYNVKVQIWDIAGQYAFSAMRPMYYKGSRGIFLVYDVTNYDSFINIENWILNISKYLKLGRLPILLIGNKVDSRIKSAIQVGREEGEEAAKKMSETYTDGSWTIPLIETSALTGKNVKLAFEEMTKMTIQLNK
ncbi:MAG: GTPase KRas precursor [Candidatus Heimdallarchaeota archaeon LC_3]|nr:MAG: GTPase KRas precursor [Candidatus Heimdallarchaeota archaeon LC_3]